MNFPNAACLGMTEVMYPDRGGDVARAKAVCKGCPHIDECLQCALDNEERFGVWGGLSAEERVRIIRSKNAKRCGYGHPLIPGNIIVEEHDGRTFTRCRTCRRAQERDAARRYRAKKGAAA